MIIRIKNALKSNRLMRALTGMATAELQQDRAGSAGHWASVWGVTVALKGAYTAVAEPGGTVRVSPFSNPGLASGGTGDRFRERPSADRARNNPTMARIRAAPEDFRVEELALYAPSGEGGHTFVPSEAATAFL